MFLLVISFRDVDEKLLLFGSKLVFIPIPTIKNFFSALMTVSCKIPQIFFFQIIDRWAI